MSKNAAANQLAGSNQDKEPAQISLEPRLTLHSLPFLKRLYSIGDQFWKLDRPNMNRVLECNRDIENRDPISQITAE
jgi:hypothetical protein